MILSALPARAQVCDLLSPPGLRPGWQLGCSVDLYVGSQGAAIALGANLGGNDRTGSVTLCLLGNGWKCEPPLPPADGQPGDEFGRSVAVDDDWLFVGAPFAKGSGVVYVYKRDGRLLTLERTLTASDAARGDQFGLTLALSGDTLIVGAPNNVGSSGSLAGAVYVFQREGDAWSERQKLTASDARPFDNFGFSLAIDGNIVVIGAPFHDGVAGNSGEAYVFLWKGNTWSQMAKLTASDAAAGDEYGSAVAVSGSALVVGARADDVNGMRDAGSAYVYEGVGGWSEWNEVAHLLGEAAGDRFGVAAALKGDQLVIGALLHGNGNGAAYPFVRQAAGTPRWVRAGEPFLGDAPGGRFGQAVSTDGGAALVGAYLAKGTGTGSVCPFPVPVRSADLGLVKSGPASAKPGDTITYTLTVTNNGPDKATGVHLEDPIPAGLQPVPRLIPGYCRIANGRIVCEIPELPVGPGQSVPLGFTVLETCAIVSRDATVSASEGDPNSDNNKAPPVATAVIGTADLKISKTGPASVKPGDPALYNLTVTNLGPDLACGVTVRDSVPAGLGSPVLPTGSACSLSGSVVRCTIAELPAGASSSFQVSFRALAVACGSTIVNTATVSAAPPTIDPVSGNNSAMVPTALTTDLSITKKADRDIAQPGQTLRYTITVKNPDGCQATVRDFFPAGLTNVQWCKEQGGPCAPSTPGNLFDVVTGSATYDVQGTVSPAFIGTLVNTATVEGSPEIVEADLSNNLSTYPAEIFMSRDIPTLSEAWLATLALLLALLALRRLRRRAL
jgi:uncharacterized repeat protein (TIGR01451 family)